MGVKVKAWKGAWWLKINHKGRRKSKRVGVGKEGKKAAELAAVQIQARLVSGDESVLQDTRGRGLTFQEHTEAWLKNYVVPQRKAGTAEKYEAILRKHWFPAFARMPLTALTRDRIKAVLAEKSGSGLKSKTIKGHLDVLRACLSAAVEDDLLATNPASRLGKFVTRSGESREVETFTRTELTTVLETAEREMPAYRTRFPGHCVSE